MKRFLVRCSIVVLTLNLVIQVEAETRPNVLLISIDDLNDWVGCLGGNPQALTPNIDRLASEGVLFKHAYCAAPSCNPSRTATLTGILPWNSGVYRNEQRWREVLPDVVTLPEHFRKHGYYSAGGGKIFHHYQNDARSWDEYFPSIKNGFPPNPRAPISVQPKFEKWKNFYKEFSWGPQAEGVGDEQTGDFQSVQYVIKKLKMMEKGKPFFLNCGIYRPHVPWFVPQKYYDAFPIEAVKLPKTMSNDLSDLSQMTQRRIANNKYYKALDGNGLHRGAVQGYLASVMYMDAMVGLLLDAIDESEHKDNTIVVFWSDHGFHMSEKQWYRKYTLWDDSCHVPLIVRLPKLMKGYASGAVCERTVGLVDLYPTLVDLAGLPGPVQKLGGRSLTPLLKNPKLAWEYPVITVLDNPKHIAVRFDEWTYIRRPDGEELYSYRDRHQFHNLAGHERLKNIQGKLRSMLPERMAEIGKPVRIK